MTYQLKQARRLSGLTLREAGAKLGMSHNAVSKYEKGEIEVDATRLQQFATAYGVTIDYLIGKLKPVEFGEITWFNIDWNLEW